MGGVESTAPCSLVQQHGEGVGGEHREEEGPALDGGSHHRLLLAGKETLALVHHTLHLLVGVRGGKGGGRGGRRRGEENGDEKGGGEGGR